MRPAGSTTTKLLVPQYAMRPAGIEPAASAWKAKVLPLHHGRRHATRKANERHHGRDKMGKPHGLYKFVFANGLACFDAQAAHRQISAI